MARRIASTQTMNTTQRASVNRKSSISAEALIGTGITVAMFGFLFVLLGWAQHMREAREAAWLLLPIGVVLMIIGFVVAMIGGVTKHKAADFQKADAD